MQQQPLQPSEMPKRETPYAQAEQKVVPTTTDSNVKVEKIIEKVVVEEKKSPVVVEDPSMYQRGIIFKNLSILINKITSIGYKNRNILS